MVNRYNRKCFKTPIIREMKTKLTVLYQLMSVSMSITKSMTDYMYWRGWREKGTLNHCWQKCILLIAVSQRSQHMEAPKCSATKEQTKRHIQQNGILFSLKKKKILPWKTLKFMCLP